MTYEALFDIFDVMILLGGLNDLIYKIHGLRAISQFYADLFEFDIFVLYSNHNNMILKIDTSTNNIFNVMFIFISFIVISCTYVELRDIWT